MKNSIDINRYFANLEDERNSAELYRLMAKNEQNPKISEVYLKLAGTEDMHAEGWAKRLREAGVDVPIYRPSLRIRVLKWLVRYFGTNAIVPTLSRIEARGSRNYSKQPEALDMVPAEQSHARILQEI